MTSGKLLQSALEFIDKVDAASGLDEIRLLLLRSARQFGFHSLIVCDVPVAGGPLDVHLCECPPGFFERYMARGYYAHDPLARHASQTTEPFLWSEVQWDHSRGSAEQLVMDEAAGAGLEEGFVVPIVGLDGAQSGIGLSGPRTSLSPDERGALHLMSIYAHHAVRKAARPAGIARGCGSHITDLERECLTRTLLGETAPDIGDRLGLSQREVDIAQRVAARRLGVGTTIEAAAMAILCRDISL